MTRWFPLLVALALTCGCRPSPPASPPARSQEQMPLRFGMIPFNDLTILYRECETLARYLENRTGREITFVLLPDYASMTQLLMKEKVDVAWATPATYIKFRDRLRYEVLCSPIRNGKRHHTGVVLVRADTPYRRLGDLRGTRFAYVDRYSTTGFVYPNLLMAREGIDPLSFFAGVYFTYNHSASVVGLAAGSYDAVAVYDTAPQAVADRVDVATLRVIARTPPIPPDPILVRAGLPPAEKATLRELMLAMDATPLGRETLAELKRIDSIDAFVATSAAEYVLPPVTALESPPPSGSAPSASPATAPR